MPERDGMVETNNIVNLRFKTSSIYFKRVGLKNFISNMIDVSSLYRMENEEGCGCRSRKRCNKNVGFEILGTY
ncbi:MAG: hypothetical protein ACOWYE_17175 [Desulfatiglandales bacterium]